jgi:hypothetical protein
MMVVACYPPSPVRALECENEQKIDSRTAGGSGLYLGTVFWEITEKEQITLGMLLPVVILCFPLFLIFIWVPNPAYFWVCVFIASAAYWILWFGIGRWLERVTGRVPRHSGKAPQQAVINLVWILFLLCLGLSLVVARVFFELHQDRYLNGFCLFWLLFGAIFLAEKLVTWDRCRKRQDGAVDS